MTVTKTNQNPHPAPTKVYPVYGVTVDKKSTSSSLQKFTDGYKAACAAVRLALSLAVRGTEAELAQRRADLPEG